MSSSLSPFDAGELSRILGLIDRSTIFKVNVQENEFPHSTRIHRFENKAKFFNFCGPPCARLDADRSVCEDDTAFHPLTSGLSFALDWENFNRNIIVGWTGISIYVHIIKSLFPFIT
ncbi:hypothetical protein EDB19DRAFT_1774586 [Suillus lakei]|nr:hypothetical protein EDB19DRAFT_1774586 [Suillus lakei]